MTNELPTRAAHAANSTLDPVSAEVLAWMRNGFVIFSGSLFIAICAHVTLPLTITPAPITLQDFGVIALALLIGPRLVMFTTLAYLAEGAAGLPVFAPGLVGLTGAAHILGPTGGYLMAYPTAAVVVSFLWRTGERSYLGALVSAGAGNIILLTLGGLWLGLNTHISPQAVIAQGVAPFLPGDAIKVALAAFLGNEWYRMSPAPRRPLPTINPPSDSDWSHLD
ncbi:MAG: biotin transporter BioY [Terracidiphilus sp.]